MSTKFDCPACGKAVEAPEANDRQVRCPFCDSVVTVPEQTVQRAMPAVSTVYPSDQSWDQLRPTLGLAVVALCCGVGGLLVPIVGLVGVLIGIVAIVLSVVDRKRYGGRWLAVGGACIGMFGVILPLILIPDQFAHARELSTRLVCSSNVRGLGTALTIYANESKGQYPPSLQVLLDSGDITERSLICPSSGVTPTQGTTSPEEWYIYIPGQNKLSDPRNVLIYEKRDNHGGEGSNVLYCSGLVEFVKDWDKLDQMIEETKQRIAESKQ